MSQILVLLCYSPKQPPRTSLSHARLLVCQSEPVNEICSVFTTSRRDDCKFSPRGHSHAAHTPGTARLAWRVAARYSTVWQRMRFGHHRCVAFAARSCTIARVYRLCSSAAYGGGRPSSRVRLSSVQPHVLVGAAATAVRPCRASSGRDPDARPERAGPGHPPSRAPESWPSPRPPLRPPAEP